MSSSSSGQLKGGDANRGSGFVHLNTPADIRYTAGRTLSLSALRQRKSRVECVVLPESMSVWREAFQRYSMEEGYSSYAADIEDGRFGNGPVLPPLGPQRAGPVHRRANKALWATDAFFCTSSPPASLCTSAPIAHAGAYRPPLPGDTAATTNIGVGANSLSALNPSNNTAASADDVAGRFTSAIKTQQQGGIAIVSHHKILGRQQFVYPDHDGVLSAGVVPQIVITAEEKAEEAAEKAFYISPLTMTEEELAAFEELQALWKSRARSHSFLGAQHRQAAKGAVHPSSSIDVLERSDKGLLKVPKREGVMGGTSLASRRGDIVDDHAYAEAEMTVEEESTLDKELAEALRMADDLLRFA
ncbi:nuclear cap binding complex subunit CBP30, putative [Leishmania panamensis]|uniref:Nuclear cap binding complex subunit CBP30, putative n=1 Tax=Leishmania panamensis TaxID=5679 RepID=A0A088RMV6_LEIPA|nr:nuclear cap binding complex subunit CBP30, putative [Leishmania panamensis]AIN97387.1 nuclear cap binding complex subunit CBP30, putative [Leishmania panamensis]